MKRTLTIIVLVIVGFAIFFRLYPKPDITSDINRIREETAPQFDSFNKSLAAQHDRNTYIRYLILTKKNLPLAQQLVDSELRKITGYEYYEVLKGQIYDAKMQYDSALFEFDLAMKRDSFPFALEEQAKTLIKLGKYDRAIIDYRTAYNRNFDYSYPLAMLFDTLKQKDSALKYFLIYSQYYPSPEIEKRIKSIQK